LKFEVVVSKFDEDLDKSQFPSAADYAKATATHKALEVALRLEKAEDGAKRPFMVLGSDTVVEAPDGTIMEKPADEEAAMRMLLSLQGVTHQVHSGVGIVFPDPARTDGALVKSFSETTRVTFAPLQEAEIRAYIKTGEPFDKAGGYGA
jgi:septum formation protein|tara:strand:- start:531 stop:977 length:447 start_codon:yes stop_codon:yes gene_type:complete